MLMKLKNTGILALALAAGITVLQPATAMAADKHDGGAYHNQLRTYRDANRGSVVRERRDFDRRPVANRYYYGPSRSYGYPYYGYPASVYPYNAYPNCPR